MSGAWAAAPREADGVGGQALPSRTLPQPLGASTATVAGFMILTATAAVVLAVPLLRRRLRCRNSRAGRG